MRIIAGKLKNRAVRLPKCADWRPTTGQLREAVFNISQTAIEGAHALDLFAGCGSMGLEALSRGAQSATFVESNRLAIRSIYFNIDNLGVAALSHLVQSDVLAALRVFTKQGKSFDWIYVDPPYGDLGPASQPYGPLVLGIIDAHDLLTRNGSLFLEQSAATALPEPQLHNLTRKSCRRLGRSLLLHYVHTSRS